MPVIIQEGHFNKAPPIVEVIHPRKKSSRINKNIIKKRTAAYCRVSTDSDEQELSFETQCEYYRNFIRNHPDYTFVNVYADEGISGTSLLKRDGFNQMMEDAINGKIDLIITKSITRFARNTVDCLKCLRILKEHNVDVYFEMENIHSMEGGEMLITILSSLAQESSQEKSDSVKWGYRRQFEKGKVYGSSLYGYKSNKGVLIIIENEANIVREIYTMYLQGMSDREIACNLTQREIPTKRGKTKWNPSAIRSILTNSKYTGNSINGKTYNVDFLHPKRLKNTGQAPMYIVENSHPAIISQEIFDQVQIERARRINNCSSYKDIKGAKNEGQFQTVNTLSSKMICANCGSLYRRAVWTKRSGEKEPVWRCTNRLKNGKRVCHKSVTIKEKKFFDELKIIINDVLVKKKDIVNQIANKASEYINPKDIVTNIKQKNKELEEVNQKISKTLDEGMLLISRGVQDEEGLKEHLDKYYKKKKILLKDIDDLEQRLKLIREVRERKILKSLKDSNYTVNELSQEEISVFIQDIIVKSEIIQITITNGDTYTISTEKVK